MKGTGLDALEGKGAAPGDPNAADDCDKKDDDRTDKEKKHQANGSKANGAPKLGEKKKMPGVDEAQKAVGKTADVNKAKDTVGGVAGGAKGATGKVPGLG